MVIAIEGVAPLAIEGFLTSLSQASEALGAIPARLEAARVHDTAFGKLVDAAKVRDAYHERLPATEQNIAEARELIGHLINQFNGVPEPAPAVEPEPQPEPVIAADAEPDSEPAAELIPAQAAGAELLAAAPSVDEPIAAEPLPAQSIPVDPIPDPPGPPLVGPIPPRPAPADLTDEA